MVDMTGGAEYIHNISPNSLWQQTNLPIRVYPRFSGSTTFNHALREDRRPNPSAGLRAATPGNGLPPMTVPPSPFNYGRITLVVEEPDAGIGHDHTVFVAGLNDVMIADGTARLDNVLDATLVGAIDGIAERHHSV